MPLIRRAAFGSGGAGANVRSGWVLGGWTRWFPKNPTCSIQKQKTRPKNILTRSGNRNRCHATWGYGDLGFCLVTPREKWNKGAKQESGSGLGHPQTPCWATPFRDKRTLGHLWRLQDSGFRVCSVFQETEPKKLSMATWLLHNYFPTLLWVRLQGRSSSG